MELRNESPWLKETLRALHTAKEDFNNLIAKSRLNKAVNKKPPPTADFGLKEDPIYIDHEKLKHWTAPHLVAKSDKKNVLVHLGRRQGLSNFNISQVKPANHPSMSKVSRSDLIIVNYTEIINELDPFSDMFNEAKQKEIEKLIRRGTFKIYLREEAGDNPNIIPSRFVLATKKEGSEIEMLKARFCSWWTPRQRKTKSRSQCCKTETDFNPNYARSWSNNGL